METKDVEALFARLDDLIGRAARGEVGVSAFLSPKELHYARGFLCKRGSEFVEFGGYGDAERKRIYVLPEYMDGVNKIDGVAEYGTDIKICALKVRGSGFCQLSHRDFMGAVLGLGIERSVIGDIVMIEENTAVIICDDAISSFLESLLDSVGKDKVKVEKIALDENFAPQRSYAQIKDTVASARLDCVVGALCSLSREKARQTVIGGAVEMDYETCEAPDKEVKPEALVSVRGFGKFRIISLSDKTKKGRFRLEAEKFL